MTCAVALLRAQTRNFRNPPHCFCETTPGSWCDIATANAGPRVSPQQERLAGGDRDAAVSGSRGVGRRTASARAARRGGSITGASACPSML